MSALAYDHGRRRITLTLPVPPSANRWWRKVGARMLTSREARQYKESARIRALAQGARPIRPPQRVSVSLTWYQARRSGDLDKRLGVLLDALQGVAYETDAQVAELHAVRRDDPARPRVEVVIAELEDA